MNLRPTLLQLNRVFLVITKVLTSHKFKEASILAVPTVLQISVILSHRKSNSSTTYSQTSLLITKITNGWVSEQFPGRASPPGLGRGIRRLVQGMEDRGQSRQESGGSFHQTAPRPFPSRPDHHVRQAYPKQAKYLAVPLDEHLTFHGNITAVHNGAAFAMGRLTAKSILSLKCKLRLSESTRVAHARPRYIHRMQGIQNRFMRKATGATSYVWNEQYHVDLKLTTLLQFMKRLSKRFFDSAERHWNPLIRAATKYVLFLLSYFSDTRWPHHTPSGEQ